MGIGYSLQLTVTFLVLAIVLYLLSKYSKRIHLKHFSGDIKIIDRRFIDHGVSLVIVGIEGSKYLLSVSNKNTELISKLE